MKSKHSIYYLLLLLLFFYKAEAQPVPEGKVEIVQDKKVETILAKHKAINEQKNSVEGWSILIFFDSGNSSKTNAYKVYEQFITKYPEVEAYVFFQEPQFKVRVGNFRTALEAQEFLHEITLDYPEAFRIKCAIELPKID